MQFSQSSRIVIIGQAPGKKVHESGVPWQDDSGDHLRSWLAIDSETFYDPGRVALVPMGFCYPGKRAGGDAPPRPECAPTWHARILQQLPKDALFILSGQYAQKHYLERQRGNSLTETVRNYTDYLPRYFPLPHPSWRSKLWMRKHPWFEETVLPELRRQVSARIRS